MWMLPRKDIDSDYALACNTFDIRCDVLMIGEKDRGREMLWPEQGFCIERHCPISQPVGDPRTAERSDYAIARLAPHVQTGMKAIVQRLHVHAERTGGLCGGLRCETAFAAKGDVAPTGKRQGTRRILRGRLGKSASGRKIRQYCEQKKEISHTRSLPPLRQPVSRG